MSGRNNQTPWRNWTRTFEFHIGRGNSQWDPIYGDCVWPLVTVVFWAGPITHKKTTNTDFLYWFVGWIPNMSATIMHTKSFSLFSFIFIIVLVNFLIIFGLEKQNLWSFMVSTARLDIYLFIYFLLRRGYLNSNHKNKRSLCSVR